MKAALILFVRNAVLGKVKTRIAKRVGEHEALMIYKNLLESTLNVALPVKGDKFIFYSDYIEEFDHVTFQFAKEKQEGEDLGLRMLNAFKKINMTHDKIILIGSDCPYISSPVLEEAFIALDDNEVVLGPAEDGGYYLIGMRRIVEEIFIGLPWSQSNLLDETVKILTALKIEYSLLKPLADIDTIEDWQQYQILKGTFK
jgi:rSAM/selenodomain-associated transferase 1